MCVEEDLSLSSKNETLIQRAKKAKARIKYMKGFDFSVRFAFFVFFLLLVVSLRDREVLAERGSLCLSVHTPPSLHLSVTLSISRYTHTTPSLSLCLSVPLYLSICPSVSLYIHLCVHIERDTERD